MNHKNSAKTNLALRNPQIYPKNHPKRQVILSIARHTRTKIPRAANTSWEKFYDWYFTKRSPKAKIMKKITFPEKPLSADKSCRKVEK